MRAPQKETPGVAVGAATQAGGKSYPVEIIDDRQSVLKGLLLARARRANIAVFETGCGGYAVNFLEFSREVPDLRALQVCLGRLGVQP